MNNFILSTFRHPEFFDNSRIITGTITEKLFNLKMPNYPIISSYYELSGSKTSHDGSINLYPFVDYNKSYQSNHSIIPWWVDHSQEHYDLYASEYWQWLRLSLQEVSKEENTIIKNNAEKLLSIIDQFDTPYSEENLGHHIASFSQTLANYLNPSEQAQVTSYANSGANALFLSLSMELLPDNNFQKDLTFLSKNDEIDWCYSYQVSSQGIAKIGNNSTGWFSRRVDTVSGKSKGSRQKLSSEELIDIINKNKDKKNNGIVALGYYTDILRYLLFEKTNIYHLGDDRDCMQYISEKRNNSKAACLQLLNRKSESFDPFEEKLGRKLTLVEAFLLNGVVDIEAHINSARQKQNDLITTRLNF